MQLGTISLPNVYCVWLAEGLTSIAVSPWPRLRKCAWRYSASSQGNCSAACVFFRQKKSPILLACPALHFLTGIALLGHGESFHHREDRSALAPRRGVYTRCSTKAPAPGDLLPASEDPTVDNASLCKA